MNLEAEKIEILKTKVKLTLSLDFNDVIDSSVVIHDLVNLAVKNVASANILKQVFTDNGVVKIGAKHTFY